MNSTEQSTDQHLHASDASPGEALTLTEESHGEAASSRRPASTGLRRTLVGRVTSNKMLKTVTVLVERKVKHPLYGKYMVQSKKVHAHTEQQLATGAVVEVQECRPISKTKTWTVVRVLNSTQ